MKIHTQAEIFLREAEETEARHGGEQPLHCPYCGRPMTTIWLLKASTGQPVRLAGCAECGITMNEFPGGGPATGAAG